MILPPGVVVGGGASDGRSQAGWSASSYVGRHAAAVPEPAGIHGERGCPAVAAPIPERSGVRRSTNTRSYLAPKTVSTDVPDPCPTGRATTVNSGARFKARGVHSPPFAGQGRKSDDKHGDSQAQDSEGISAWARRVRGSFDTRK